MEFRRAEDVWPGGVGGAGGGDGVQVVWAPIKSRERAIEKLYRRCCPITRAILWLWGPHALRLCGGLKGV